MAISEQLTGVWADDFLMIHNSYHTPCFMIQKEANQCRGWTTETYLSTVTDTVDLKWKFHLTLKKK